MLVSKICVGMLLTILITTIVVLAAVQADQSKAFIENAGYENSQFGPYPNQTFMTNSGVTAPVFNIIQPAADGVAQADYLFLGPKGDDVGRAWPTIVNATDLSLVWSGAGNLGANALDVRVQSYKGKDYVTFYSGSESGSGFGGGLYYMVCLLP